MKMKLTKLEKSWILYDVGNSAYTMLACSLIPIWFKAIAIGDPAKGYITSDKATAWYSATITIITLCVAFLSPILGTFNDKRKVKKMVFTSAVAIGVLFCILNSFVYSWALFLIVFAITKTSYQVSQCTYDSMLVDITSEDRMDEVSSHGYAWGYIGSCLPFIISLIFYILGEPSMGINLISPSTSKIIGFSVTALWWFIVTIPLIKGYEQINYDAHSGPVLNVFVEIFSTLKGIFLHEKKIFYFLAAYFFYIDGVGTIIDNCINVGTDLGLNTVGQVIFLLGSQVVAFVFSLVFIKLSRKIRTINIIKICIFGYIIVSIYALFLEKMYQFAILAVLIGMFQGSIQSFSRSYFTKIIPPEKSGEYFGIYDIFCRGASFLGSLVIAVVKFAGGTINIALALLAILFITGFILLLKSERYVGSPFIKS